MIKDVIVSVLAGLICLVVERVTDPKRKSKRKKQFDIELGKARRSFYIWLALAYIGFVVEITNGTAFWLRLIFAGVAGMGFTECAIIYYRINKVAQDAHEALAQKGRDKHGQKRIHK